MTLWRLLNLAFIDQIWMGIFPLWLFLGNLPAGNMLIPYVMCLTVVHESKESASAAEGTASRKLNLVFLTIIFDNQYKPYYEKEGDKELWTALSIGSAALCNAPRGLFNYLRGFSYYEKDRLHVLKPATMRNWSRTAALNDADADFRALSEKANSMSVRRSSGTLKPEFNPFKEDYLTEILGVVASAWASMIPPKRNEIEDHITFRLAGRLANDSQFADIPYDIVAQSCQLLGLNGQRLGRLDLRIRHRYSQRDYFAFEAKRLHVIYPGGRPSNRILNVCRRKWDDGLHKGAVL